MKIILCALIMVLASGSAIAEQKPYRFNRGLAVDLVNEVRGQIEDLADNFDDVLGYDAPLNDYTDTLAKAYHRFVRGVRFGRPIPNLCFELDGLLRGLDNVLHEVAMTPSLQQTPKIQNKAEGAFISSKELKDYFNPWCHLPY